MMETRMNMLLESNRRIPPQRFDQSKWCGTSMCQIGWFCHHYPDEPLRMEVVSNVTVPTLGEEIQFEAIAQYFDITYGESLSLFGSRWDVAPAEAVANLERFIAEKKGLPHAHK